jgi:hypothetical protein
MQRGVVQERFYETLSGARKEHPSWKEDTKTRHGLPLLRMLTARLLT